MRLTTLCVRSRVDPSAPYVTETKPGASGASRCSERHRVDSIAASAGGKNSKDTRMGAVTRSPRSTCSLAAVRGRSAGDRREHVLTIGLDGTQPVAEKAGRAEQPPQTRQRVLDDPVAGTFERFVPLEQPQPTRRREYLMCLGQHV